MARICISTSKVDFWMILPEKLKIHYSQLVLKSRVFCGLWRFLESKPGIHGDAMVLEVGLVMLPPFALKIFSKKHESMAGEGASCGTLQYGKLQDRLDRTY